MPTILTSASRRSGYHRPGLSAYITPIYREQGEPERAAARLWAEPSVGLFPARPPSLWMPRADHLVEAKDGASAETALTTGEAASPVS